MPKYSRRMTTTDVHPLHHDCKVYTTTHIYTYITQYGIGSRMYNYLSNHKAASPYIVILDRVALLPGGRCPTPKIIPNIFIQFACISMVKLLNSRPINQSTNKHQPTKKLKSIIYMCHDHTLVIFNSKPPSQI